MKNHLKELSNYLTMRGLSKKAECLEKLLFKFAQVDNNTWEDDRTGIMQTPNLVDYVTRSSRVTPITDTTSLDLEKHPLGHKIWTFLLKIFNVADDGSENVPEISAPEMQQLVDTILHYDSSLNHYKRMKENKEPITKEELSRMLFGAMQAVSKIYVTKGTLDHQAIRDFINNLIIIYDDTYKEEILGETPDEAEFYTGPYQKNLSPKGELSDEQRDELWARNDMEIDQASKSPWLAGKSRIHREQEKERIKKEFPKEWHSILLPDE